MDRSSMFAVAEREPASSVAHKTTASRGLSKNGSCSYTPTVLVIGDGGFMMGGV
jgi:hypothetical protein